MRFSDGSAPNHGKNYQNTIKTYAKLGEDGEELLLIRVFF
jgi:hypothetical protein